MTPKDKASLLWKSEEQLKPQAEKLAAAYSTCYSTSSFVETKNAEAVDKSGGLRLYKENVDEHDAPNLETKPLFKPAHQLEAPRGSLTIPQCSTHPEPSPVLSQDKKK